MENFGNRKLPASMSAIDSPLSRNSDVIYLSWTYDQGKVVPPHLPKATQCLWDTFFSDESDMLTLSDIETETLCIYLVQLCQLLEKGDMDVSSMGMTQIAGS